MNFIDAARCFVTGIALFIPACLFAAESKPNILLILADDVGSDANRLLRRPQLPNATH